MLTKHEATAKAEEYLKEIKRLSQIDLVLLESETFEFQRGWVYFYQSRKFVESGDVFDALGGNGPLIIDKYDGTIHQTGTAHPVEHYIEEYTRALKK